MAVFTKLTETEARKVCDFYQLGTFAKLEPIAAGSVNSNFFLQTDRGRFFARIYEEQALDGVCYERALTSFLAAQGFPVPRCYGADRDVFVHQGKPLAVFDAASGDMLCQASIDNAVCKKVGALLAQLHQAGVAFSERKQSRFAIDSLHARLDDIHGAQRPELEPICLHLRTLLQRLSATLGEQSSDGVIHGDLFRDNILWHGGKVTGIIDWESASDGPFAFDLMVVLLSWCYDSTLRRDLSQALVAGYMSVHQPAHFTAACLHDNALLTAARFTITRITDCYLRESLGQRVYKDYTRFWARLQDIEAHTPASWAAFLGL